MLHFTKPKLMEKSTKSTILLYYSVLDIYIYIGVIPGGENNKKEIWENGIIDPQDASVTSWVHNWDILTLDWIIWTEKLNIDIFWILSHRDGNISWQL